MSERRALSMVLKATSCKRKPPASLSGRGRRDMQWLVDFVEGVPSCWTVVVVKREVRFNGIEVTR